MSDNEEGKVNTLDTAQCNVGTPLSNQSNNSSTQCLSTLKIPPFWSGRPDLWFLQVESQFKIKNITSPSTKYDYLVASLPTETMELVSDYLLNPSSGNKYDGLKTLLLSRSRDSEERRLDALLHKVELGDYKPSDLYRKMESLAGGNSLVNSSLLKKLWLNKLPPHVQTCIIAIESSHSLDDLFKIADRIYDAATTAKISVVSQPCTSDNQNLSATINQLSERIKRLEVQTSKLNRRSRSRSRSTYKSNSFQRKATPSRHSNPICHYHQRFGSKARNCVSPCNKANEKSKSPSRTKNEH